MFSVTSIKLAVRALTPEQKARVVHVSHQAYDVYVGRMPQYGNPRWGNPEQLAKHGHDRERCITAYIAWLMTSERGKLVQQYAHRLRGKTLGCHCRRPNHDLMCHGMVLVALAESDTF